MISFTYFFLHFHISSVFCSGSKVNITFLFPCSSAMLEHIITMATAHFVIAPQVCCVMFAQTLCASWTVYFISCYLSSRPLLYHSELVKNFHLLDCHEYVVFSPLFYPVHPCFSKPGVTAKMGKRRQVAVDYSEKYRPRMKICLFWSIN